MMSSVAGLTDSSHSADWLSTSSPPISIRRGLTMTFMMCFLLTKPVRLSYLMLLDEVVERRAFKKDGFRLSIATRYIVAWPQYCAVPQCGATET
jgi:hypothetical protein